MAARERRPPKPDESRSNADWWARALGILSLLVAAFGVYSHRQDRLAVRPRILIDANYDSRLGGVGLILRNAGEGPAVIRSMTVVVDGVKVGVDRDLRWPAVTRLLGTNFVPVTTWFEPGEFVSKGQRAPLFVLSPPPQNEDSTLLFREQAKRLGILVCYCSVFGDCYGEPENLDKLGDAKCDLSGTTE